ncbi:F-type H+-transporting ATPase subunit J [Trichoderma harzianum]|uniref:F-type H+-transporting ATPase subunit J n=1 Tax=Trichoderma harzianum TaxID=5544 RepID=A0A0F9Z9M4_TRIHA|nr:F-type H+-transporting ATPase subunit J [Trichoderma harzianum]
MSWFGVVPFKKFPAPFLKPYWPFFAAVPASTMRRLRRDFDGIVVVGESEALTNMENLTGLVIAYGANSAQNAMMASDEWKNDPRNPNAKAAPKAH